MNIEENTTIQKFLEHNLSAKDTDAFLKRMEDDLRFRESVLFEKQLWETQNENHWSFIERVDPTLLKEYEQLFRSKETDSLKKAIEQARVNYHTSSAKSDKKWILYLAAAVVAILITVSVLMPGKLSSEELYTSYYDITDVPSLVSRGVGDSDEIIKAQELFEAKKYDEALKIFDQQLPFVSQNVATLLVYKGLAEMELNKYDEAIHTFDLLSNTDYIDASKGLWYKSLLLLKLNRQEEAKVVLLKIGEEPSNYRYKQAQDLLKQL